MKAAYEMTKTEITGENPKISPDASNWNEEEFLYQDHQPKNISSPIFQTKAAKVYGQSEKVAVQYAYADNRRSKHQTLLMARYIYESGEPIDNDLAF